MEFKNYVLPLLRWWWLLLATTLVAVVSSYLVVRQQLPIYQARTTLMVGRAIQDPNPSSGEFQLGQQLAQMYADIARRDPVRDATVAALGLEELPEYYARALPNTQLLEILVSDTDAQRAQAVAGELAKQLIRFSPTGMEQEEQERKTFVDQELDDLQTQIETTKEEISAKQRELAGLISARQIADTQTQLAALQTKLTTLQTNYATLLSTTQQGATNTLTVIEPASLPRRPVGPNSISTILTAAAIAFLLAAGAAYLIEYMDDTVKSPADIRQSANLPTLGIIAKLGWKKGKKGLVALAEPDSPTVEAFRALGTGIQHTTAQMSGRMLLVTSAGPGAGKSFMAANLAVVLARAGYRVLLMDGDLRRASQHKLFELSNDRGMVDLLSLARSTGSNSNRYNGAFRHLLTSIVKETPEQNLKVITSGRPGTHPAELLGGTDFRQLMNDIAEEYDIILIDSPPCLAATEPLLLSTQADGVLMVADTGVTRKEELRVAVERLRGVEASLIGVILNRASLKNSGYQYYLAYQAVNGKAGGTQENPT